MPLFIHLLDGTLITLLTVNIYYVDNRLYGDTVVFVIILVIAFEHWWDISSPQEIKASSMSVLADGNLILVLL